MTAGLSSSYTYDKNSNILSITRSGITDYTSFSVRPSQTGIVFPKYGNHNTITLGYSTNGNKLSSAEVTREGADYEGRTGLAETDGTVTGFAYDANGNLTKDPVRDIVLIKYNHLNLPTDVYFGNGQRQTIEYHGNGVKRSVKYSQTTAAIVGGNLPDDDSYTVTSTRTYVGPHIYADGVLEYSAFGGGYFDPATGAMYYLTDWQGNNAAVAAKSGAVVQATTYYPYGEPTKEPTGQCFLYGGKEREHGGGRNSYDFSARCLIAPLGQWGVPDRQAEKFYPISIYSYCGGDPINYIDPDGGWRVDVHVAKDRSVNGFGTAIVYDRHNEEIFRFTVRAEGIRGHDRMKEGADTPLGKYKIPKNCWIIPDFSTSKDKIRAYGQYPRLIMEGAEGEIIESGRSLIRIHGGRQEIYDAESDTWKPIDNPELKRTEGCLRAYDIDMRSFKAVIDEIETTDKQEIPEYVDIIDDLDEYTKKKYEVEYR